MKTGALIGVAALAWVLALGAGCNSKVETSPDRRALRPVSLPDLSRTTEPVRQQLRERYSSLTQRLENPNTTTIELGRAFGEMGKLLMAAEYRDEAESCFINARALTPNDMRWPYYLGHLYRTRGETAKSAAAFEQALVLRPDDVATLVWLGDMYLDQGRSEAAEPLLAKALSLQPGSVAALFGLGRAALARRDYVKAVEHLEKALSLDRQATIIHYPLAMAYRGRGDLERAEAHLRQRGAGEIRPPDPLMQEVDGMLQSVVAFEVQGAKALDEGDWAAAAAYFRKGIALAPNEPSPRHKLGTALFLAGDARGAAEQFEEALRLSPTFPKAHYSLGIMMGSSGRLEKAIEHLSAAVTYDPNYVEARLRLADVLRQSGRPEESLPHYAQVVKSDPRVADAPFGYALALVHLKRYREARDRFAEGMKVYPDHPEFAHAVVRLLAAAPDDRVRDGRRAMELMRSLPSGEARSIQAGEMMAMILAELGQYDEAATWQRDAMAAADRAGRRDLVPRLAENLKLYERHRPCRVPWRDDGELLPRGKPTRP